MKVFRLAQLSPPLYSQDLDITKPGGRKPAKRYELETSTRFILSKADFKNVRFLANFTTEAGAIIGKSKTKISLKAQRKVAREIKTARILGLMPFTSTATVFGCWKNYGKS